MHGWVVLTHTWDGFEARSLAAALQAAGVEVRVLDEQTSAVLPHLAAVIGCRVLVPEAALPEAREALEPWRAEEGAPLPDDVASAAPDGGAVPSPPTGDDGPDIAGDGPDDAGNGPGAAPLRDPIDGALRTAWRQAVMNFLLLPPALALLALLGIGAVDPARCTDAQRRLRGRIRKLAWLGVGYGLWFWLYLGALSWG